MSRRCMIAGDGAARSTKMGRRRRACMIAAAREKDAAGALPPAWRRASTGRTHTAIPFSSLAKGRQVAHARHDDDERAHGTATMHGQHACHEPAFHAAKIFAMRRYAIHESGTARHQRAAYLPLTPDVAPRRSPMPMIFRRFCSGAIGRPTRPAAAAYYATFPTQFRKTRQGDDGLRRHDGAMPARAAEGGRR